MRSVRNLPRRWTSAFAVLAVLAVIAGGGAVAAGAARADLVDWWEDPAVVEGNFLDVPEEESPDEEAPPEEAPPEEAPPEEASVEEEAPVEEEPPDESGVPAGEGDEQRPVPSPAPTPVPPQSPPDPATADSEFHLAVNTALNKLKRFEHCNEFVTGLDSPGGESALSILEKIWRAPRLYDLYSKHGTPAPDGRLPYAEATQGKGSNGTIRLYQEWHQSKPIPVQYNNDDGGKPLDLNEWRTLILLHEVAHLTNAMGSHRTEAGNERNTYAMNQGILLTCLRGR